MQQWKMAIVVVLLYLGQRYLGFFEYGVGIRY